MTVYWIVFLAFCIGHLAACYLEWEPVRKATKVGVIPLLMLGLRLSGVTPPLLLVGLALGWLGDVFLIYESRSRCFVAGTLFFVLGHFCYIAATMRLFFENNTLADIPPLMWLVFVLLTAALYTIANRKVAKHIGAITYLGASYFVVLTSALLVSLVAGQYLLSAAFVVFLISDTILCVCKFAKPIPRKHFYIMSSYILAQILICISLTR